MRACVWKVHTQSHTHTSSHRNALRQRKSSEIAADLVRQACFYLWHTKTKIYTHTQEVTHHRLTSRNLFNVCVTCVFMYSAEQQAISLWLRVYFARQRDVYYTYSRWICAVPFIVWCTLHSALLSLYLSVVHSFPCIPYLYIPMTSGSHKACHCGGHIRPQSVRERGSITRSHVHLCKIQTRCRHINTQLCTTPGSK